jgi:hypothetical protein
MPARVRQRVDVSRIVAELRVAQMNRKIVTVQLTARCECGYLTGRVEHVAPSGAFALLAGWHVPTGDILCVTR